MLFGSCSCCKEFCKDNALADGSSCEGQFDYSYGPVFDLGDAASNDATNTVPKNQEIIASRQTVTVPAGMTLPVLVRGCGGCDDGFAIDGVRVANFAENMRDTVVSTRTFTVGTWNDGGPAACTMTLCFFEYNPLP
jgi:hypothetical protein